MLRDSFASLPGMANTTTCTAASSALALGLILSLAAPSFAAPHPALAPHPATDSPAKDYSAAVALGAPLLATGASLGLFFLVGNSKNSEGISAAGAAGVILAPSLGHMYTGGYTEYTSFGGSTGLILLGAATTLGGTIYSLVDAPYSAKRANQEQRNLTLAPAPIQGPDRSVGYGGMIQASF